jgi:hypothetical protein
LDKHGDKIEEVLQLPGETVITSNARSRIGHSALSLSWCTCDASLLKKYTELEMSMATRTTPMEPTREVPTRGCGVSFSISCELLQAYDAQYERDPIMGFVSTTAVWCKTCFTVA